MSDSIEIFSKVSDYVERQITLWDLESWIVPRLRLLIEHPDSAAGQLAGSIELCLAELQEGITSERSIRALLKHLIGHSRTVWITYPETHQVLLASTSNVEYPLSSFEHSLPGQSQSWSTELEVVNV